MRRSLFLFFALSLLITGSVFAEAWERAEVPRNWKFPRDHGAHREFKTEWWYFTGNLTNSDGDSFGYQLTIFRQGIQKTSTQSKSAWTAHEFFFGHFTISDCRSSKFYYAEATDRGALGLAGASNEKMEAWIGDWKISTIGNESYRLQASHNGNSIDFTVEPSKPLVFQGDRGLSQKGEALGNASHYYSYSRLKTTGTLRLNGKPFSIKGDSWFDHEFSTSALDANQAGWDWFSIQLDSGEEAMIYLMRTLDGKIDPHSNATWIDASGKTVSLKHDEYQITPINQWISPQTKTRYPSGWKIQIPRLEAEFAVIPRITDQELTLKDLAKISYWEGACEIDGVRAGKKIKGFGYTELTGYSGPIGFGMKEKTR